MQHAATPGTLQLHLRIEKPALSALLSMAMLSISCLHLKPPSCCQALDQTLLVRQREAESFEGSTCKRREARNSYLKLQDEHAMLSSRKKRPVLLCKLRFRFDCKAWRLHRELTEYCLQGLPSPSRDILSKAPESSFRSLASSYIIKCRKARTVPVRCERGPLPDRTQRGTRDSKLHSLVR